MASLNWSMLSPSGQPTPLPQEKFLLSLAAVTLSLFPCPPGSGPNVAPQRGTEFKAQGSVHLSNQRVVFVAPGSRDQSAGSLAQGRASVVPGTKGEGLQTLSVPYSHFVDGRFVQPWFGATYYEGLCLNADGGGLDSPHLLRLYFKEAGGFQFYETVEEMKSRLGTSGRGTPVEALPLYTPASSSAPTSTGQGSSSAAVTSPLAQPPSVPSPSEDDLLAASVARSAQDEEYEAMARSVELSGGRPPSAGPREDGPPGYAP